MLCRWFLIHFQSNRVCYHRSWDPTPRMFSITEIPVVMIKKTFLSDSDVKMPLYIGQEDSMSQMFQEIWNNCYHLDISSL